MTQAEDDLPPLSPDDAVWTANQMYQPRVADTIERLCAENDRLRAEVERVGQIAAGYLREAQAAHQKIKALETLTDAANNDLIRLRGEAEELRGEVQRAWASHWKAVNGEFDG